MIPNLDKSVTPAWLEKNHSYAGWVPNVSGQLSFSIIGTNAHAHDTTAFNAPSEDHSKRFVVIHQKRWSTDFPVLRPWLLACFIPNAGVDYIMIAETANAEIPIIASELVKPGSAVSHFQNAHGVLAGTILIIPRNQDRERRKAVNGFIDKVRAVIADADDEKSDESNTKIIDMLSTAMNDQGPIWRVSFALFRTGETRLWFDPNLGCMADDDEEMARLLPQIPKQVFYFVRDMVHRHYHHDSESDQFVALTKISQSDASSDPNASELAWRRQTLWGLARVITQFRRAGRWDQLNKSLGVIAYAEAFQRGFATVIRSQNQETVFELTNAILAYDFAQLRESIKVSVDNNQFSRAANWQGLTLVFATIFSLFALWATASNALHALCEPEHSFGFQYVIMNTYCSAPAASFMTAVLVFVVNYFWLVIIATFLLIWFLQHNILRDRPPFEWPPFRWLSHAADFTQKFMSAIALSLLSRFKRCGFMSGTGNALIEWSIGLILVVAPPCAVGYLVYCFLV